MADDEPVIYEESTPWPPWVALLVSSTFLVPAAVLGREALDLGAGGGGATRAAAAVLVALAPVAIWLLVGRQYVRVAPGALLVGMGFLPVVRRRLPLEEIATVSAVGDAPRGSLRGWGAPPPPGEERAWTLRGGSALRVALRGGGVLYLGSRAPARLAEALRRAGGGRWEGTPEGR